MEWGFLAEFWNAITQVGDYTVEFFQSIGNAVAGAIGGLFEDLVHHIYDIFYIAEWFVDNLSDMFAIAFRPLTWIFNFVRGFFVSATGTIGDLGIELPEILVWTTNVKEVFETFPYLNLLITGIAGALGLLVVSSVLRKIIHI